MAAALWQAIDMTQADGGLASCFKAARVAPSLIENLTSVQKFETLRDFAESYSEVDTSQSYYELLLDTIWQADAATKEVRAERGRLLSAWKAASTAIIKLEETPARPEGANTMASDLSWEAPLQEDDRNRIWADWEGNYAVRLEAHVRPGEPLVCRTYRELRMWQLSACDVRKWKSVLHERTPDSLVETRMTSRSVLVEGVQT